MRYKFLIFISLFASLPLCAQRYIKARGGEVLAHSLSFNPDELDDNLPEALREMMVAYANAERMGVRMKGKAVTPLLRSKRHQDDPFNSSCPYYRYADGTLSENRCETGCVATALEQVVSYWRHPAALTDTLPGWTTDNYDIPDVLPGTPIDWENILDYYEGGDYNEQQAKAVADLTYFLGVASRMKWGVSSSAASLSTAFHPLYEAFDYKTLAYVQRSFYTPETWNRMLRNELENGRPVVYTGHTFALTGHCFVIDGVDEDGYYHCVWGEHNHDGYFDLDFLNEYEPWFDSTSEGQACGFFTNQTALFMHPDDFVIDISDSLRRDDAFRSVRFEQVRFLTPPVTSSITQAEIKLTNPTDHPLSLTFEGMSYRAGESDIFHNCDYVLLTTVHLQPHETKNHIAYCQFRKDGERVFGVSTDDETIPLEVPIVITKSSEPTYSYELASYELLKFATREVTDDLCLRLHLNVTNTMDSGTACSLHYYCLTNDDGEPERRHFGLPQVPASETSHEVIDFHRLTDGMTYNFHVRYPYATKHILAPITVRAEEATAVNALQDVRPKSLHDFFDLQGRPATGATHGIIVTQGRKVLR